MLGRIYLHMKMIVNFILFASALAVMGVTYRFAPVGGTFVMALLLSVTYLFIELTRNVSESSIAPKPARSASGVARAGDSENRLAA